MWILFQCVYNACAEAYQWSSSTEETLTCVNAMWAFILVLRHFVLHRKPQCAQVSMAILFDAVNQFVAEYTRGFSSL